MSRVSYGSNSLIKMIWSSVLYSENWLSVDLSLNMWCVDPNWLVFHGFCPNVVGPYWGLIEALSALSPTYCCRWRIRLIMSILSILSDSSWISCPKKISIFFGFLSFSFFWDLWVRDKDFIRTLLAFWISMSLLSIMLRIGLYFLPTSKELWPATVIVLKFCPVVAFAVLYV